ncbi:hypothetical protein ANCDUO_12068, partial [Ancylostoma duodenale]
MFGMSCLRLPTANFPAAGQAPDVKNAQLQFTVNVWASPQTYYGLKNVSDYDNNRLYTFANVIDFWEDAVVDNIDEEYDRLVQHIRDSAREADGSGATKRRLSCEILELIRQRGAARAAGNYQLTSELAKRCREAMKEGIKHRRAAVLAEAAEAGKSIRSARRDFAN